MILAGFPPTITLSGTSFTTIAPAATIEFSPTVTPLPTTARSP
ncbi:MAG TPA: acetyltransferase, partial [Gammaproteobacteria bacterium]|nr:acetyltransferase [Gammaproteobacteria bacterium]